MTTETGESNQRLDARRNREQVIEAALGLLARNPDASMQEVADASRVGRTTVYRHFQTKDELISALLRQSVEHTWREAQVVFERGEPLAETLAKLSRAMVAIGVRYRFMLNYSTLVSADLKTSRHTVDSPIRAYFLACQERGEIRDDLPIQWIMSSYQALSLVAMQDLAAGFDDEEEAARLLGESLAAILVKR